jgi:hypothetical protein
MKSNRNGFSKNLKSVDKRCEKSYYTIILFKYRCDENKGVLQDCRTPFRLRKKGGQYDVGYGLT